MLLSLAILPEPSSPWLPLQLCSLRSADVVSNHSGAPWIASAAARNVHSPKGFISIHLLVVHGNGLQNTRANNSTEAGCVKVCAA